MNRNAAKQFVLQNARPIDLAVYKYFFENGSNKTVIEELLKYQNQDGGFGNGLEADYWNPNSSPIATNDAICKDTEKYGVEYVPVPSDFFAVHIRSLLRLRLSC